MNLTVDFGAAQSGIGYRFFGADGAFLGARVTAGIAAAPQPGVYVTSAAPPTGTVGIYWDCAAGIYASEDLRDALAIAAISSPSAVAIAAAVRDVDNTTPAAGSLGAKVNTGAASGDPWAVTLPGSYGTGTAGKELSQVLGAVLGADQMILAEPYVPGDAPVITIPAQTDPALCTGYLITRDAKGAIEPLVNISFQLLRLPGAGQSFAQSFFETSDTDGLVTAPLVQGATYKIARRNGEEQLVMVPQGQPTFQLPNLLGVA